MVVGKIDLRKTWILSGTVSVLQRLPLAVSQVGCLVSPDGCLAKCWLSGSRGARLSGSQSSQTAGLLSCWVCCLARSLAACLPSGSCPASQHRVLSCLSQLLSWPGSCGACQWGYCPPARRDSRPRKTDILSRISQWGPGMGNVSVPSKTFSNISPGTEEEMVLFSHPITGWEIPPYHVPDCQEFVYPHDSPG